jgi:hypothetical protein
MTHTPEGRLKVVLDLKNAFCPATTFHESVAPSFVNLSEADLSRRAVVGSAVPRTSPGNAVCLSSNRIVISTGAKRSGETCGFLLVLKPIKQSNLILFGPHSSRSQSAR